MVISLKEYIKNALKEIDSSIKEIYFDIGVAPSRFIPNTLYVESESMSRVKFTVKRKIK